MLPSASSISSVSNEMRRKGRVRCKMLECSLGRVTDLSASGMRVQRPSRLENRIGEHVGVVLAHLEGELHLRCRVRWLRASGFRREEIGLQFLNVTPQLERNLYAIAQCAADRLTIGYGLV